MHVLYLILTIVATVAILWFGMPWVFETIHEPFQGGPSATCRTQDTIQVLAPQTAPDDFGSYIEHGKQIYNRIGYGQSMLREGERAFKDRITEAELPKLNEDIRQALVNVSVVPDSTPVPESARPIYGPTGIVNKAAVLDPNNNWNAVKLQVGYVEERLPPTNLAEKEALRCESVNLYTTYTPGGEISARPSALKREDMCNMLGTRDASTGVIADLRPELAECGVCIKDGQPVSTSETATWRSRFGAAMKFIGGMLFTNRDRDAYYASGDTNATPSLGDCAPGYFFVAGEKDKCLTAARRLNCEEYGQTGGFGSGKSNDGQTDAELSKYCVACPTQEKTNYVYNDTGNTLANVRVRITVPKGTGQTTILYGQNASGTDGFTDNQIKITSSTLDLPNVKPNASTLEFPNAKPNDSIRINIFQEYPHRPRGEKEVFFVQENRNIITNYLKTQKTDADNKKFIKDMEQFAKDLDCTVATVQELQDAYNNGAQAPDAGYAIDSTYFFFTIRQYTNLKNTELLNPTDKKGVHPASSATGIWCYGYKPQLTYLNSYAIENKTLAGPEIANFYTYIELKNEDGLSADNKKNRFSQFGTTMRIPQYRGICIQFESTDSKRAIPAENFIIKVNNQAIRNADGSLLSGQQLLVSNYSRNGTFADSQRIVEPKPATAGMNTVLTNQYWLWNASHESSGFKLELKIPGIFADPFIAQDLPKCPTGPLYTSRNLLSFVELSACSDGLTLPCMTSLFQKYGKIEGEWHPSKPAGREALEFKDTKKTVRRTPEELIEFLKDLQQKALGKSPSLSGLSVADKEARMNEASRRLLGQNIVSACDTLVESPSGMINIVPRTGNLPAECLNELYKQTTEITKGTTTYPATYKDIAQRYSGIRADELALPEIQSDFPYRTCQPTGSWAPIRSNGEVNEVAVAQINAAIATMEGGTANAVANARELLDKVYQNANSATMDKAIQQVAIERCYGIKKKEFVSNCQGINAKKIRTIPAIKSVPYTYFLIINDIYWTDNINVRTGRMTKTEASDILNTIKNNNFPTANFVSSNEILALRNIGHVVYTVWAYDTNTRAIEPMRIATNQSSVGRENFTNTSKYPMLISVQSSDTPTNLIKTIMDVLPNRAMDGIPQKSVEILTRTKLISPQPIKVNTKETVEYTPQSNKPSKKVFIVGPPVYRQPALDILSRIKGVYSNADFTSEYMIQELRTNKQIAKCAWVWSRPTNSSDIQIALGSPDGWKYYNWCGGGSSNISTHSDINAEKKEEKEIYITLTSSDPDLLIIQKITAALGSSSYLNKVYDEEEYMNTDYNLPSTYLLSTNTTIQSVQISSTEIPSIVQILGENDRILTQRLAIDTTLELNQIDLLPALAYKDLLFPATGAQKIRLESFVGQGWFLSSYDGRISNMETRTTFTLKPGVLGTSSSSPSSANVSKIYRLEGSSGKFMAKSTTSDGISIQFDTPSNTSWVIRPALNGASAFVSLELANYPGVFLITEIGTNESYTAKCVQYTDPTELEKALACWRLYPSDVSDV